MKANRPPAMMPDFICGNVTSMKVVNGRAPRSCAALFGVRIEAGKRRQRGADNVGKHHDDMAGDQRHEGVRRSLAWSRTGASPRRIRRLAAPAVTGMPQRLPACRGNCLATMRTRPSRPAEAR